MKMNTKVLTAVIALVLVAGGGTVLAVNQKHDSDHQAMVMKQDAAMKKAEENKAMKAKEAAAMKEDTTPASEDAMMHDDAMTKTDQ
jgi:hypothetical protein